MSFPVENIRALCKKRGTSLAALERSLGFGNGLIAGWETAKSYQPYDRVSAVAAALGVSIEELTGKKSARLRFRKRASLCRFGYQDDLGSGSCFILLTQACGSPFGGMVP